jgi:hypothetical protein
MIGKKNSKLDLVLKDRNLLKSNSEKLNFISTMLKEIYEEENLSKTMHKLSEELKYANPQDTESIIKKDESISYLIDDIKILFSKNPKHYNEKEFHDFFRQLHIKIVERIK